MKGLGAVLNGVVSIAPAAASLVTSTMDHIHDDVKIAMAADSQGSSHAPQLSHTCHQNFNKKRKLGVFRLLISLFFLFF